MTGFNEQLLWLEPAVSLWIVLKVLKGTWKDP